MSKGQRGNKEAKKPRKAPGVVTPLVPGDAVVPPVQALPPRQKRR